MPEGEKIIKKLLEEPNIEIKNMSIIYDKKQYSVRVPKDFVETIKETVGDLGKLKFRFTLKIPSPKSNEKPKLTGELVYE